MGDYIAPNKGVRIYCETTKPHVTPETFNFKMDTALDEINNLQQSASKAKKSLNFIANYGKQSFIITLVAKQYLFVYNPRRFSRENNNRNMI